MSEDIEPICKIVRPFIYLLQRHRCLEGLNEERLRLLEEDLIRFIARVRQDARREMQEMADKTVPILVRAEVQRQIAGSRN